MKVSYRRLWFSIGAFCLILPAISVATSGRRVFGAGEIVQKPQKNPKLSAQLVLLSRSVKQESERPAVAGAVSAPGKAFRKTRFPNHCETQFALAKCKSQTVQKCWLISK